MLGRICFTTADIACYDWCIIKVVSMMEPSKSNVAPITTCHVSCEKHCNPSITWEIIGKYSDIS